MSGQTLIGKCHEVVFFGRMAWGFSRHLWHHLAREFARDCRTFYVDPLYSENGNGALQVAVDETVSCAPVSVITFGRLSIWNLAALKILSVRRRVGLLGRHLKGLKLRKPAFVFYNPWDAFEYRRLYENATIIYYATDNGSALCGPAIRREYDVREEWLCKRADLVLGLSKIHTEQLRSICPAKTFWISEGVDPEVFAASAPDANPNQGKRPTVCYIGTLDNALDWPLLERTAGALQDIDFLLVGPILVDDLAKGFEKFTNVRFTGYKEYADMAQIMLSADLGIIFYSDTEFNRMRNPIKLLEYFAAGKMVVSVDFPAAHDYEGLVIVAKNDIEFSKCIASAIQTNASGRMREQLIKTAGENTWRIRKQEIEALVAQRAN